MRILAIGAHPDDLEISCGGTLALFARAGHDVVMCNVALGDRGSFTHTMEEIGEIRLAEARRGAQQIGATHATLGIHDTEVNSRAPEQRHAMVELIRRFRPDLILTHADNDYMTDHIETGRLVEDTSFMATVPLYETDSPALEAVPALYYVDNSAGIDFHPTEYVDISDVLEVKLDALRQHESQISWISDHDGADLVEETRIAALFRGAQCGVAAAEGFRPSLKHLRLRTKRLLP